MSEVSAALLEILRCPRADHGRLREDPPVLVCTVCGERYDVIDGMPVMLAGEHS
ncbi:MAG: hypothetical protein KDC39_06265 [Actinobacteria bacterium]|nr:hypothetical protein [Actinomycetota bacterium]